MSIRCDILFGILFLACFSFSTSTRANTNELGTWATCNMIAMHIGGKNMPFDKKAEAKIFGEANNRDFIFSSYEGQYTDLCQQYTPQMIAMVAEAKEEFHNYDGNVNDPEAAALFHQRELDLLGEYTEEKDAILRESKEAFEDARKNGQTQNGVTVIRSVNEKRIEDERVSHHDEREKRLADEHEKFRKKVEEYREIKKSRLDSAPNVH